MLDEIAGIAAAQALLREKSNSDSANSKANQLANSVSNLRGQLREVDREYRNDINDMQDRYERELDDRDSFHRLQRQLEAQKTAEEKRRADDLRNQWLAQSVRIDELERKLKYNEALLKTNIATIADHSAKIKDDYMENQDILSNWMTSQKGFKDIATKFGAELGYTSDQVYNMSQKRGIEVMAEDAPKYRESSNGEYSVYDEQRLQRVKLDILSNLK